MERNVRRFGVMETWVLIWPQHLILRLLFNYFSEPQHPPLSVGIMLASHDCFED